MSFLHQASASYNRGYTDFYCRRQQDTSMTPGTFRYYDYMEGWNAAFNEIYWTAVAENKNHLYHEK